jgi:hypothetical protein
MDPERLLWLPGRKLISIPRAIKQRSYWTLLGSNDGDYWGIILSGGFDGSFPFYIGWHDACYAASGRRERFLRHRFDLTLEGHPTMRPEFASTVEG